LVVRAPVYVQTLLQNLGDIAGHHHKIVYAYI
jgi:hypothetical protein